MLNSKEEYFHILSINEVHLQNILHLYFKLSKYKWIIQISFSSSLSLLTIIQLQGQVISRFRASPRKVKYTHLVPLTCD